MSLEFIKYLSFLFLMYGECRGEPLIGQYYVATVAFERNMEILDTKQFNCFSKNDIIMFNKALNSKKYQKILLNNIKNKISIHEFYYWSILYIHKDFIKLLNYDRKYYYMTEKAFKHCKIKYPKWINKINKTNSISNHIFFNRKEN